MAQNKKKHKHKPLPSGMTYADKLAQDKMIQEAVVKAAESKTVEIKADIISQQRVWLHICSMCEAFGIGEKRLVMDYFTTLDRNADELEEMKKKHGEEYAIEKLRQRVEKLSGIPIEYMYEREMLAAKERNEAKGVYFPVLEDV